MKEFEKKLQYELDFALSRLYSQIFFSEHQSPKEST